MTPKTLVWSEHQPPGDTCHYNHCTANTPFGRFLITWKGWKEHDSPTVDETPWGDYFGSFNTVVEAQTACEQEFAAKLAACVQPTNLVPWDGKPFAVTDTVWVEPGRMSGTPTPPVADDPNSWEANVKALLNKSPHTVWQRPGNGEVDLKATLAVTFLGMQQDLAKTPKPVYYNRNNIIDD